METQLLINAIENSVFTAAMENEMTTRYRHPLVGYADAHDPNFPALRRLVNPDHLLPEDLVEGAQTVISFFLPFARSVVKDNQRHPGQVSERWITAYLETNELLAAIQDYLVEKLEEAGHAAAAVASFSRFDRGRLAGVWNHPWVGVIAGLGSFGLNHLVITDAGCAGRFGSVVTSARFPVVRRLPKERCLYFTRGTCLDCMRRCPVGALHLGGNFDQRVCYERLLEIGNEYSHLGRALTCGKCATGPCALRSAT